MGFALIGALVYIALSSFSGLYEMRIYQSKIQELKDILLVSVYWFFIYIAILYLSLGFFYTAPIPRLIVLFSIILSTILVIFERGILDRIEINLIQNGILEKTKILLILRSRDDDIVETIRESAIYEILGYTNTEAIHGMDIDYI
jgi:FlaA1/EpsC-like NDP-sugar epimerase